MPGVAPKVIGKDEIDIDTLPTNHLTDELLEPVQEAIEALTEQLNQLQEKSAAALEERGADFLWEILKECEFWFSSEAPVPTLELTYGIGTELLKVSFKDLVDSLDKDDGNDRELLITMRSIIEARLA